MSINTDGLNREQWASTSQQEYPHVDLPKGAISGGYKVMGQTEAVIRELRAENAELEKHLTKYRDLALEGTEWQAVYRKQISELQDQLAEAQDAYRGSNIDNDLLRRLLTECQKERDQFKVAYADAANDYNAGTDALTAAQARIAELVEALEIECGGRCNAEYNPCNARTVISRPDNTEALNEYRDQVIEEVAQWFGNDGRTRCMEDVRALKGKQN